MTGYTHTKQLLWLTAAALILTAACPAPAHPASTLVFKAVTVDGKRGRPPAGRIYCGRDSVMTLAGRHWQSITDAREVARRLNILAEEGIRPEDIRIHRRRTTYIITARGERIVEVHGRMAKFHRSNPLQLARTWSKNLQSHFAKPYLSVAPVAVPIEESRTRPVRGNIAGDLTVRSQSSAVSVSYDSARSIINVYGRDIGRTELIVTDAHSVLRVPVRCAQYAARITRPAAAGVTGNPASPLVIARAAEAAVGAGLHLEPGAWASVRTSAGVTSPLPAGRSVSVPVRVSAAGEDYLSRHAQPVVVVHNDPVPSAPIDLLMVSNSPERIPSHGLWFEGSLADFQSARLLFHHVNGSDVPADLVVELWNLGRETARVHIIEGLGGPTRDESWAGHKAAAQFLSNRSNGLGWIVPVAPRTAAPVLSRHITPGATASGLLEIRALMPADLRLRLYLSPRRAERTSRPIDYYSPFSLSGKWQYPDPRRDLSARYVVGRDWAFVTIGDQAAAGLVDGDRLAGNYGVIYNILLELTNPSAEQVPVVILLEPAGGPARGALLIDGTPVEAAVLTRDSEAQLARYLLAPGETRRVHVETIPQGGSHYPVRLVARPI